MPQVMAAPYRIAGASGFWGDRNDALLDQVRGGPVDAVMLDYLAEITMSILRVKKMRGTVLTEIVIIDDPLKSGNGSSA